MRKLIEKIDKKYAKICIYASVTVLLTIAVFALVYYSGGFWKTVWSMFLTVLKPIIIGYLLMFLFQPAISWIEKRLSKEPKKWTRAAAVAIFYAAVVLILIALLVVLVFAVKGGIESISFNSLKAFIVSLRDQYQDIVNSIQGEISSSDFPLKKISGALTAVVNGITGFFSALLFGVIFSVYFMLDEKNIRSYWGRVIRLLHGEKAYKKLCGFANEAKEVFSGYIRGQSLDALIVCVASSIALTIAGIPYSIAIGLLIGVGNLIPYVGPLLGFASISIICLISGEFQKMLIGCIILIVIMFVDSNIINPKLLSNSIEVHPLLVVAALLAGGAIGGVVGMVVAVPTAAFIKLQFDKYLDRREQKLSSEDQTE